MADGSEDSSDRDLVPRARRLRSLLRVGPDRVDLSTIDPRGTPGLPAKAKRDVGTGNSGAKDGSAKAWSRQQLQLLGSALAGHQERLYASAVSGDDRRRVLLVLQAMDCGGKDGTVKSVVRALNPQGVRITTFGPPTPEELGHHFLWRINRALPGAGQVGVFNRSHYEDVLAVRVRSLVPEVTWRARFDQINAFESDLAADGLTIVKIMLHISAAEQRERLLARLHDPTKRWKFNPGDLDDRTRWRSFHEAYEDALTRCSADHAPWYVVPADRKWYRNWAVANVLLAHFVEMGLSYPDAAHDVEDLLRRLDAADAELQQGETSESGKHKVNNG